MGFVGAFWLNLHGTHYLSHYFTIEERKEREEAKREKDYSREGVIHPFAIRKEHSCFDR
jgi:hypothetical protein